MFALLLATSDDKEMKKNHPDLFQHLEKSFRKQNSRDFIKYSPTF